jgi:hypothetical protein
MKTLKVFFRLIFILACILMAPLAIVSVAGADSPPTASQMDSIARYDLNKNGKLDPSEIAAIREARRQARNQFDTNGDGKLDPAERTAATKAWLKQKHSAKKENPLNEAERLVKQFDANRDGHLDDQERLALLQEIQRRQQAAHTGP